MKKFVVLLFMLVLASCTYSEYLPVSDDQSVLSTNTEETVPIKEYLPTPTAARNTIEPAFTPTPVPTATNTPKPYDASRNKILAIMEAYGYTDAYYVSDAYWELLYDRIDSYGPAERITTLEYHGNNYNMYDGAYSMNPETFYSQIEYLMKNDYHFVTIHELRGFLEGWLDLPLRSIILTTDSGYSSQKSIPSMISQFAELEVMYGYKPHMQSYIWTKFMTPEETIECKDDSCWETFRFARDSGYFTIGTHSQSHDDFSVMGRELTKDDLTTSIDKIYENLGIKVYAITWPFEACTPYVDLMSDIGIKIGFGGYSKPILDAYVYKSDLQYMCLPRLFPPHGGGVSARPNGKTLEQMLYDQINH